MINNDFTLHYTLSNGYIWDFHLLLNTSNYSTSTAYTTTTARCCILIKTTEYYGHYLLTTTHGSDAIHTQLLRTLRQRPIKDYNRTRGSGQEFLNYMSEPATVQSLQDLRQSQTPKTTRRTTTSGASSRTPFSPHQGPNYEQRELLRTTPVFLFTTVAWMNNICFHQYGQSCANTIICIHWPCQRIVLLPLQKCIIFPEVCWISKSSCVRCRAFLADPAELLRHSRVCAQIVAPDE